MSYPVDLTAKGKAHLDKVVEKWGGTQKELLTRILRWFLRQDQLFQMAVVSGLEGKDADLLLILVRHRAEFQSGSDVGKAAEAARHEIEAWIASGGQAPKDTPPKTTGASSRSRQ